MPDYTDLLALVQEKETARMIPAFWNFFPCYARAVGGVPSSLQFYFDVDEKLRVQLRLKEVLPDVLVLPGVFPDLGVVVEVSAFGGQIQWFEEGAPYIGEVIREPRDIDKLKPPKPGLAGLMPLQMEQRNTMRRKLEARGLSLERYAMSMGPAEVSGMLMGYEKYYLAMYDDPRRIHALMSLVTDFILEWIRHQDGALGGAELIVIADHVCHQVTPEQLHEFIMPYEQKIFAAFPNTVRIYHNEGKHSPDHINMLLDFGADIWHFGSDVHALKDVCPRINNQVVLFGGLNPHGVIRRGTPDQVAETTQQSLHDAAGQRMLFSTGTGTTPDTKLENLRAMVDTVRAN